MNPFLLDDVLPRFDLIKPADLSSAVDQVLSENREQLKVLLSQKEPSWDSFVAPLEWMEEKLSRVWDTASHLHSVEMSKWQRVYDENLEKVIAYSTELSQNHDVFLAFKRISESPTFSDLEEEKQKIVKHALRDFVLSGVHLPIEKKKVYASLQQELGKLSIQFEENLMHSTQAWFYETQDQSLLKGLPPHALEQGKQAAESQKVSGWRFGLDFVTYLNMMTYAESEELRKNFYQAYVTRASSIGPHDPQFDNTEIMRTILEKRHELAELLGFSHYADLSLQTKMLKKTEQVSQFLVDLGNRSYAQAKKEWDELEKFAGRTLQAWDASYVREKYREKYFNFTDEQIRKYFPLPKVLSGLFGIVNLLYEVEIHPVEASVWHPSVRVYRMSKGNEAIAYFYLDLFTRHDKREGAWAAEARSRFFSNEQRILPVAYLTCNFDPPNLSGDAYLTHDQVITLFHEFGHGLQMLLTTANYPSLGGTHGIAWDVVEVASQHFENWCWEKEAIAYIADQLPAELLKKMLAAKQVCSAMDLVRQVVFALYDFELHLRYPVDPLKSYQALSARYSPLPPYPDNRFPNSFAHIFAGGYAAAYYSYLWAEVLSSDIFAKFKAEGLFNEATAKRYHDVILSRGGIPEPDEAFFAFMGREPRLEAFLTERGIS